MITSLQLLKLLFLLLNHIVATCSGKSGYLATSDHGLVREKSEESKKLREKSFDLYCRRIFAFLRQSFLFLFFCAENLPGKVLDFWDKKSRNLFCLRSGNTVVSRYIVVFYRLFQKDSN